MKMKTDYLISMLFRFGCAITLAIVAIFEPSLFPVAFQVVAWTVVAALAAVGTVSLVQYVSALNEEKRLARKTD